MALSGVSHLWRRALLILALLCLVYCGWNGLVGAWSQHFEVRTVGQRVQTVFQALYGALSLAAIATVFRGRQWQVHVLGAWIIVTAVAAGLAPFTWGKAQPWVGLVALVITMAVAGLVAAMLRTGMHGFGLLRPS